MKVLNRVVTFIEMSAKFPVVPLVVRRMHEAIGGDPFEHSTFIRLWPDTQKPRGLWIGVTDQE